MRRDGGGEEEVCGDWMKLLINNDPSPHLPKGMDRWMRKMKEYQIEEMDGWSIDGAERQAGQRRINRSQIEG